MVVVAAHVYTNQGKQQAFVEHAQNCIQNTRLEEGNMTYILLSDTEDDCHFTFFEEWKNQEALDAHVQTPHFQAFSAGLATLLSKPLDVNIYEAEKKA